MRYVILFFLFSLSLAFSQEQSPYPGYHLEWNDEFNGAKLDNENWKFWTGGHGWGNDELEYYTARKKNVFVKKGKLVIEARKEKYEKNDYTSGLVTTQGKREFKYGRIDIRAKLPKGKGIWPALWLLGNNHSTIGWPASGEVDIMELLGHEPGTIYATMHWGPAGASVSQKIGGKFSIAGADFSKQFHVFSFEWDEKIMKWYVDNVAYFTSSADVVTGTYPFDNRFFILMNIAVGGKWPGYPDEKNIFPQRMYIDYVRVYQKSSVMNLKK